MAHALRQLPGRRWYLIEIQEKDREPRVGKPEEKPKEEQRRHEDPVDEASDESFPASDPPAH